MCVCLDPKTVVDDLLCFYFVQRHVQGNMPKTRQLIVKEAFERLAASCGGSVTIEDIRRVRYCNCSHA